MTDKYQALREAAQAATPGPWTPNQLATTPTETFGVAIKAGRKIIVRACGDRYQTWANAKFIAAANPTAILALLAECDALRDAHQNKDTQP